MSYYSRPSTSRYAPRPSNRDRGRSPSPTYSFRDESPPAGGYRFSSRDYYDDEPRYERPGQYRSPSPASFGGNDDYYGEPRYQSRRARFPSPPPRNPEPSCFSRPETGGRSRAAEDDYYQRRMKDLFDAGMNYNDARVKVEREMARDGHRSQGAYPREEESKTRSRREFKELSAYAKRRMEELFYAGMDYETAREIVAEEEAERNPQSKPQSRPRADSPPRRRQPSFASPRDEKPRSRNTAWEPVSDFAKRRMEDLYSAGIDYAAARKIVEEEEAERSSKPKSKSGKPDLYSDWDIHPNAGTDLKYKVSHDDMEMYIKMMEDLVRGGMSRADAVKMIDKEIHDSMKNSGRGPRSDSAYDPPPRNYSSSHRYRSPSPPPFSRRDDRYGGSRRGRDDEARYGY